MLFKIRYVQIPTCRSNNVNLEKAAGTPVQASFINHSLNTPALLDGE